MLELADAMIEDHQQPIGKRKSFFFNVKLILVNLKVQ
jgi:hypothetical protein